MVGWALEGLRRLKPEEAVPFEHAITLGQRGAQVGNQNAQKDKEPGQNKPVDIRFVYGSTNVAYLTARLARDHPDILARLEAGDYPSVRAAAKAAGIVNERTPAHELQRWWETIGRPHPLASFMANTRQLNQVWPEIVRVNPNDLPLAYDDYRRMAVCNLEPAQKEELRAWAEETRPKQAALRQEIRARVDANQGIYRPDFQLMVSNHWVFQLDKRLDGFDGGVNYDLYANLADERYPELAAPDIPPRRTQ